MKLWIACIVVMVACGGSSDDKPKPAPQQTKENSPPPPPETKPAPPPPEAKPAKPPEPEPTTPAEIDKAFKKAMIEGRDKDVLKYCDMLKLDNKANPQSLMGCALSACRTKDGDTSKRYAAALSTSKTGKALLEQVKKVCVANNVPL